jgi:ATP-dependent DNA helicase RecG
MLTLATSLESIPKISRRVLPALKKLGIKTIRDLLFHLPSRYEDFSKMTDIRNAAAGEMVTIRGTIKKIDAIRTARKRMVIVHAMVEDETGKIRATWFNQPYLARTIKPGDQMSLSGKVALGLNGKYLQNPAYEKLSRPNLYSSQSYEAGPRKILIRPGLIHTGGLVAIYPETRGITSRWLRFLIKSFLDFGKDLPDPLPLETRHKYQLPETREAIRMIHFPKNLEEAERARKRFNFEKLLLIQLRSLENRLLLSRHQAPMVPINIELIKSFIGSLPYELTGSQRRSIWEILQDISKPRPMNRLLEGDVGSGKTVVAAAVSLLVVKKGYRAAFMAPTEILARKHFETLASLLGPFGVNIGLMVGTEKKSPDADIVVGTHALIQKNVKFENLGLVVIDEQHRFGVEQRATLLKKQGLIPHFLSMSATPIPRTLALSVYGDLDLSILEEMPKSRKEIVTKIVEPEKRAEAYGFIRREVNKGRQVFVVCPRIDPVDPNSSKSWQGEVKAVREEYKKLSEEIFSAKGGSASLGPPSGGASPLAGRAGGKDIRVAMLHGKLKPKEKELVMEKFRQREIDILVSTSVIELGVDIPNATIMMIEGAERFGLAQLHQFRGRVGRGAEQSYCFLFPTEGGVSRRLRAVVDAKNGFELAQIDLEIRGPGDIFGTKQWGVEASVLEAITDAKLVREVRREAVLLLQKSPDLKLFPELKLRLEEMKKIAHRE